MFIFLFLLKRLTAFNKSIYLFLNSPVFLTNELCAESFLEFSYDRFLNRDLFIIVLILDHFQNKQAITYLQARRCYQRKVRTYRTVNQLIPSQKSQLFRLLLVS